MRIIGLTRSLVLSLSLLSASLRFCSRFLGHPQFDSGLSDDVEEEELRFEWVGEEEVEECVEMEDCGEMGIVDD
jgi:hypothetical protein